MRTLRIHSNVHGLDRAAYPGLELDHRPIGGATGVPAMVREFLAARRADVLLVNNDAGALLRYCLLSLLLGRSCYFVALDVVLGPPRTPKARLLARLRRFLLREVDHFILYQYDLRGYERYFGISPARTSTIPFKVNLWEALQRGEYATRDEGYLLFAGRTYRDIDTFVRACALSGVPAVMVRHSPALARAHGTEVPTGERPPNLREVVDDEERRDGWVDWMCRCRGVVVPLQPGIINAAGISTLFDAMALGKPVVITHSPATSGIVTEADAELVPAGDAQALAGAMARVYHDAGRRAALTARGYERAAALGGEARLYRDILGVIEARLDAERRAGDASARPRSAPASA